MSDIDISDGGDLTALLEELDDLQDRGESDAQFEVFNNARYAPPIEFGRSGFSVDSETAIPIETESGTIFRQSVSGHPPYPFFRPALRDAEANANKLVRDNLGVSLNDAETTTQALSLLAAALESQIKTNATAGASGRSSGTNSRHPAVQTGNLRNSTGSRRIR